MNRVDRERKREGEYSHVCPCKHTGTHVLVLGAEKNLKSQ